MKKLLIIALISCIPAILIAAPKKGEFDWNLEEFKELEKKKAEKNGWKYKEENAEKLFAKMDTNKDGIASGKERKAYWDNWKKENNK